MAALNVVQVFEPLLFVNVVQHCSGPKLAKSGWSSTNFARAAYGGAEPIEECRVEVRYRDICCMVRLADGA